VARVHRRDAGDGGELALERGRDARCHGLRARAGDGGDYLNRRVIDAGQRGDGQRAKRDEAEQQNGEAHQRRHYGALDEERGEIHDSPSSGFFCPTSDTFAPGMRRRCPSVTTVSPGATPFSITMRLPKVRPTWTMRSSTVLSGLTT